MYINKNHLGVVIVTYCCKILQHPSFFIKPRLRPLIRWRTFRALSMSRTTTTTPVTSNAAAKWASRQTGALSQEIARLGRVCLVQKRQARIALAARTRLLILDLEG